jgi:hypothetical protein
MISVPIGKQYPLPKATVHDAVVAGATYLPNNPSAYGVRNELVLVFFLTDEFDGDKPFKIWKTIVIDEEGMGRGSNAPVYFDALGIPVVNGQYQLNPPALVGVNCRITLYHDRNVTTGVIKPKIARFGIAPSLPGTERFVIPPEWVMTGRTGQASGSPYQQKSSTPVGSSQPVHSQTVPRPINPDSEQLRDSIKQAKSKLKKPGGGLFGSFVTGANAPAPAPAPTPEEDADFLQ